MVNILPKQQQQNHYLFFLFLLILETVSTKLNFSRLIKEKILIPLNDSLTHRGYSKS